MGGSFLSLEDGRQLLLAGATLLEFNRTLVPAPVSCQSSQQSPELAPLFTKYLDSVISEKSTSGCCCKRKVVVASLMHHHQQNE